MNPAAIPDQALDKQEEYECYRGLFTGMVSGRSTCMGLSVLLARGMKAGGSGPMYGNHTAWLRHCK